MQQIYNETFPTQWDYKSDDYVEDFNGSIEDTGVGFDYFNIIKIQKGYENNELFAAAASSGNKKHKYSLHVQGTRTYNQPIPYGAKRVDVSSGVTASAPLNANDEYVHKIRLVDENNNVVEENVGQINLEPYSKDYGNKYYLQIYVSAKITRTIINDTFLLKPWISGINFVY